MLAERFVSELAGHGIRLFSGVPCSYLTPFMNAVMAADGADYVVAANEGDAVATAAGATLAGPPGVAMFQNSGLGNAVNPLTSLTRTFELPVLMVTSWRGQPGGKPDEPQHAFMGAVTPDLLDLLGIRWAGFPDDPAVVPDAVAQAVSHMDRHRQPFAFVLPADIVLTSPLVDAGSAAPGDVVMGGRVGEVPIDPDAALRAVQRATEDDVVIATTGHTGRALYALEDRPNQLYMVGSMGCAPSLGLGLALARPDLRVTVVDGDGAALMRLGAFAAVGRRRPPNLVHVLLDNGIHESTGGQPTPAADFPAIAAACGYSRVVSVASAAELADAVAAGGGELSFVYARTAPRAAAALPRPSVSPAEVAARLRSWMAP